MKALGVIRKVDSLGRVVIPKEIRTTLQIDVGTPLEIYTEADGIILKKYTRNNVEERIKELKFILNGEGIDELGLSKCIEIERELEKIETILLSNQ